MTTPAYEVGSNPTGWQFIPFFDVLDFKGGNQPPKQDFIDLPRPGYVRLLQIRDFTSDEKAVYIQASKKWQTCSEEDILIGRYGASVGRVLRGKSGAYNVALIKMIIKDSRINREFLYYWLHDTAFQNTLLTVSRSAQNGFNKEDLKGLAVPVPPLAEQRRIVARIEALFARTRRARTDLERIAPLGHHLNVVSTEIALRNAASEWTTVGELATVVQYGTSAKTDDDSSGIPVLRMGNIVDGKLHLEKLKYLPRNHHEFPSLILEPGDILFNRTNSAELVGKTAVYLGEPSSCSFASYLIRIRIKGLRPQLFAAYINSPAGREWAASVVSQQVGQANINGTKLRAFRVPVMPDHIQEREEKKLLSTSESLSKIEVESARALVLLDRLEQSILARAFRGDLVPHSLADDHQHPAQAVDPIVTASPRRGRRAAA